MLYKCSVGAYDVKGYFFKKNGPNPASFLFILVFLTLYGQI